MQLLTVRLKNKRGLEHQFYEMWHGHTCVDDTKIFSGFSMTCLLAIASHNIGLWLRVIDTFNHKYFFKLKVNKAQIFVSGLKKISWHKWSFVLKVGAALNLDGYSVEWGKTLGFLIDSELKTDKMESKVCLARHF